MEKSDLFDLIESYLDNTLPPEKRSEVEHRISTDEPFQREVDLHRKLKENFIDPERLALRAALSEIVREPILTEESSFQKKPSFSNNLNRLIILLATALLFIVLWYWYKSPPDKSRDEPIQAPPIEQHTPSMAGEETDPSKTFEDIVPPKEEAEENYALASADPADFAVNPSMEALVNSISRSEDELTLTLNSPKNTMSFTPGKTGEVIIRFAGTVKGIAEGPSQNVMLSVFNNKDISKPLLTLPAVLKKDNAGSSFEVPQRLKFPLGLYYFTLQVEDEILYTGKFTIGTIKN